MADVILKNSIGVDQVYEGVKKLKLTTASGSDILYVDTSKDTVDESFVLKGYTGHNKSGNEFTGTHECAKPKLQEKNVTPTGEQITVTPSTGYDGLSSVVIAGDDNLKEENIAEGVTIYGKVGTHKGGDEVHTITAIDYSNFNTGSFTETLDTGDTLSYAVEFDGNTPIKVIMPDGEEVTVKFPAEGGAN